MSAEEPSQSILCEVRDSCLCLATQRAARRLARRFDRAFQPIGLTNGQFSALMFLAGGVDAPAALAERLAMDRTTVIALLKALQRRELVETAEAPGERRRRLALSPSGRALLGRALPIWREEHAQLERSAPRLPEGRDLLAALAQAPLTSPAPAPPSGTSPTPPPPLRARRRRRRPAAA